MGIYRVQPRSYPKVKPYYEQSGIVIYHRDCLDAMEDLQPSWGERRYDLLLTDPPYGIGKDGQIETTGAHGGRKGYQFLGWDADRAAPAAISAALALCRHGIIWGGNYFADLLPASQKWLVWDKGQRINQSDGELAWTSFDGALRIFTMNRVDLLLDGAVHPTQKPESLMRWCIVEAGMPSTIFDPFMGSGTTLVAAKRLGRSCVGIEREERYCEIAARRLSQEVLPLTELPEAVDAVDPVGWLDFTDGPRA